MEVVITGGAGFIGGHIALHLEERGFDVIVVDSLERASMTNYLKGRRIKVITADLRGHVEVPCANVVIHAAAYVDVAESFEKPYDYFVNNVAVTSKIAKKASECNAFVIYLSSAAVYGNPVYLPIDENHPTSPLSPYGLTKLMGEEVVKFYGKLGLQYAVMRLFNVYGPCQNRAYAGVITKFVERVRQGLPPIIYGDGDQTRDFIHVDDVVKFIEMVLDKKPRGTFNVGTGRATSIRELAKLVIELAGIEAEPVYTSPRPGDIRHSVADIRRALSLGWKPRVELRSGIKSLIEGKSYCP